MSGTDADIDRLTSKLADGIYRQTQPYRWATYLMRHEGRPADALPIFKQLALTGSAEDRWWSYNMWGLAVQSTQGFDAAVPVFKQAVATDPSMLTAWYNVAVSAFYKGRPEEELRAWRSLFEHATAERRASDVVKVWEDLNVGAFLDASVLSAPLVRTGFPGQPRWLLAELLGRSQLGLHDLPSARISLAEMQTSMDGNGFGEGGRPAFELTRLTMATAAAAEDWGAVVAQQAVVEAVVAKDPTLAQVVPTSTIAPVAYAKARLGDVAGAQALIGTTPADCYDCLLVRGEIATLTKDWSTAERWFSEAARQAPSIPFAFNNWGEMLLAKGDLDGAIDRFTQAHKEQPRYADPLKLWGDALTRQGKVKDALAKYDEALKYAPAWPALHQARDVAAKNLT